MTEGAPRNLDVPPGPVRGPRGGGRAVVAALGLLVAVVAGAVGLALLAPAPANPARISFAVPTLAPSAVAATRAPAGTDAPSLDPVAVLADTTPRMRRDALAAAVRDGSLDGRLVFVDGLLQATPTRCPGLAPGSGGCVDLAIPGLGLRVRQGDEAVPWAGAPPPGAWLVTVARSGGLVYLGSLVPRQGATPPISGVPVDGIGEHEGGLTGRRSLRPFGTLIEAAGHLVRHPIRTCFRPGVAATPCPPPPPFLADDEPLPDGLLTTDSGAEVGLAATMPGIDPEAIVVPGTFLLQPVPGAEGGWLVIARYEPARAVRVLVP